jgi:hypothetical protein
MQPFKTYKELNHEISKRAYKNIVGLTAEVTEKNYYYFLEVLPPIYSPRGGFLLLEALTDTDKGAVHLWFYKRDDKFFCEVVQRCDHVKESDLIKAGMI